MTTKSKTSEMSELEILKVKLEKLDSERKAQMAELKTKTEELKTQSKKLKEEEKAMKLEMKTQEAKNRSIMLAESLKNQSKEEKRNLTAEIRNLMLEGKTVDEMMTILDITVRKDILDRRWLIEKRAGLR